MKLDDLEIYRNNETLPRNRVNGFLRVLDDQMRIFDCSNIRIYDSSTKVLKHTYFHKELHSKKWLQHIGTGEVILCQDGFTPNEKPNLYNQWLLSYGFDSNHSDKYCPASNAMIKYNVFEAFKTNGYDVSSYNAYYAYAFDDETTRQRVEKIKQSIQNKKIALAENKNKGDLIKSLLSKKKLKYFPLLMETNHVVRIQFMRLLGDRFYKQKGMYINMNDDKFADLQTDYIELIDSLNDTIKNFMDKYKLKPETE